MTAANRTGSAAAPMPDDAKPVEWMYQHKQRDEMFIQPNRANMNPRYWTEIPLYAHPPAPAQPAPPEIAALIYSSMDKDFDRRAALAAMPATLRQRIEALEADNARLREALKPFAKMGELANFAFAPALFHDRDQIKGLPWKDDGETVTITFGDCRRARQALGEG